MKRILGALLVLGLALPAAALNTHFFSTANAPVSVSATKTVTYFTDSQTNGSGILFQAQWVMIRSCGGNTGGGCTAASANTCYFHLGDDAATKTKDIPLEPGASLVVYFPKSMASGSVNGWTSITTICDTAQTALFRIDAGE